MSGHIGLLYVAPRCTRRGVASALYQTVERTLQVAGVASLFTEASLVARPFFERQGFWVDTEETVVRRGVPLRRCVMRKAVHVGRPIRT